MKYARQHEQHSAKLELLEVYSLLDSNACLVWPWQYAFTETKHANFRTMCTNDHQIQKANNTTAVRPAVSVCKAPRLIPHEALLHRRFTENDILQLGCRQLIIPTNTLWSSWPKWPSQWTNDWFLISETRKNEITHNLDQCPQKDQSMPRVSPLKLFPDTYTCPRAWIEWT